MNEMNKLLFLSLVLFGCSSSNGTEGYNEGSESTETNTVVSTSSNSIPTTNTVSDSFSGSTTTSSESTTTTFSCEDHNGYKKTYTFSDVCKTNQEMLDTLSWVGETTTTDTTITLVVNGLTCLYSYVVNCEDVDGYKVTYISITNIARKM